MSLMRAKRVLIPIVALLATAVPVLLFPNGTAEAATRSVNVGQQNGGTAAAFQFNPALTIAVKGDSVHWDWFNGNHTVTSFEESSPGVPAWQSPVLTGAGQFFEHVFANGGTFTYYCSIHSSRASADPSVVDANIAAGAMVGKVYVASFVGGISQEPDQTTLAGSAEKTSEGGAAHVWLLIALSAAGVALTGSAIMYFARRVA